MTDDTNQNESSGKQDEFEEAAGDKACEFEDRIVSNHGSHWDCCYSSYTVQEAFIGGARWGREYGKREAAAEIENERELHTRSVEQRLVAMKRIAEIEAEKQTLVSALKDIVAEDCGNPWNEDIIKMARMALAKVGK